MGFTGIEGGMQIDSASARSAFKIDRPIKLFPFIIDAKSPGTLSEALTSVQHALSQQPVIVEFVRIDVQEKPKPEEPI